MKAITRQGFDRLISQALDMPLKHIENGAVMNNEDTKRVLRMAVKTQAVSAVAQTLKEYINWDDN